MLQITTPGKNCEDRTGYRLCGCCAGAPITYLPNSEPYTTHQGQKWKWYQSCQYLPPKLDPDHTVTIDRDPNIPYFDGVDLAGLMGADLVYTVYTYEMTASLSALQGQSYHPEVYKIVNLNQSARHPVSIELKPDQPHQTVSCKCFCMGRPVLGIWVRQSETLDGHLWLSQLHRQQLIQDLYHNIGQCRTNLAAAAGQRTLKDYADALDEREKQRAFNSFVVGLALAPVGGPLGSFLGKVGEKLLNNGAVQRTLKRIGSGALDQVTQFIKNPDRMQGAADGLIQGLNSGAQLMLDRTDPLGVLNSDFDRSSAILDSFEKTTNDMLTHIQVRGSNQELILALASYSEDRCSVKKQQQQLATQFNIMDQTIKLGSYRLSWPDEVPPGGFWGHREYAWVAFCRVLSSEYQPGEGTNVKWANGLPRGTWFFTELGSIENSDSENKFYLELWCKRRGDDGSYEPQNTDECYGRVNQVVGPEFVSVVRMVATKKLEVRFSMSYENTPSDELECYGKR